MAETQDPNQARTALSGQLPNPPLFWKSFTAENVQRMKNLRGAIPSAHPNGSASPMRIVGLPSDLTYLQPPAEPENGEWRLFGDKYTLDDRLPSLEDQGIDRLVPLHEDTNGNKDVKHFDRAFELRRLSKSVLLNFLELMGHMSLDPHLAEDKINDIRTLFINFHHMLNEYRPHQAREQAISLMQDRLDKIRADTTAINAQVDKAKRVLEGLASIDVPSVEAVLADKVLTEADEHELGLDRQRNYWAEADLAYGVLQVNTGE
ncbi:hypothetical protein TD95_002864 [Thielaviopsis punctulata]|uniref:Mediator of RNA polymerase II transcription subunit 7 n=1 Tax=Thielaviopsis punctulata TaxID=72032 RepID=A0A0F4ZDW2_9PEZI|nr:hypothetical protein TD95_002864 [Thielaviopsis punctulata]